MVGSARFLKGIVMIKLLWVVYRPELQALEAIVLDHSGKRRRVSLKWLSKGASGVPTNWFKSVKSEIEHQDSLSDNGKIPF